MSNILYKEYRGEVLDTIIRGDIAVVNKDGVVAYLGDVSKVVYYRSSAKPIQALPFIVKGLHEKFGFTNEHLALMGASHIAEPKHVANVIEMMERAGINEEDMIMGATYPTDRKYSFDLRKEGMPKRKVYHNCSGKHVSMISIAKALGEDISEYSKEDSLTGKEVLKYMSIFTDCPIEEIKIGIDGCGLPVFAAPLDKLALGYLKFVNRELLPTDEIKNAAKVMVEAYRAAPDMIRGTNELCHVINKDRNLFGKLGANGFYSIGMEKEGLGIAVRTEDSNMKVLPIIIHQILSELNYDNQTLLDELLSISEQKIYSATGEAVGDVVSDFKLIKC